MLAPIYLREASLGIIPFSRLGGFYANLGSAEIFLPPEEGVLSTNGSAIARGLKAVEVLLRRTRPVEADKRFYKYSKYGDEYEKTGTYEAAMNDFNSVYPEGVHHYVLPKGNVLTVGQVGDRTLFVKKFGAFGQPTLEILQNIGRPHEIRSDLIIYTGIKQMP